eukprot:1161666-Pelagomonas_calceolata.AAC.8
MQCYLSSAFIFEDKLGAPQMALWEAVFCGEAPNEKQCPKSTLMGQGLWYTSYILLLTQCRCGSFPPPQALRLECPDETF